MAKASGMGDNLYIDGVDVSGDIGSLGNIGGGPAALEMTGINKSAIERVGGVRDGAIEFTSFFNEDGAHPVLSALPTADVVVSYLRGTSSGGWSANLVGKQIGYDPTRGEDGSLTLNTQAQANGYGLEWARQLTAGTRTDTEATNGTALDFSGVGDAYVALPGASGDYVSTPDAAALDITGDIDLRVHAALDDWTPATQNTLIGKWDNAGTDRSYQLAINTSGQPVLAWTEDGSTSKTETSSAATGFTDGTAHWVRATLDVDDGSSDAQVTFYTSDDGETWTQLGTAQAVGATTSIHSGSTAVEIGSQGSGAANRLTGKVFQAQIYDGSTLVANPVAGVSGVTDSEGLTWTLQGNTYTATLAQYGLQAYLHVLEFTGTSATIKLQHSSDDGDSDAFADITGGAFASVTGQTSERIQTARTAAIERYVRVVTTGTFTNLVFAVSVAVNPVEVTF